MPHERIINPSDSPESADAAVVRCIHFRSKAMYVTGEVDPRHIDEEHNHDQNCWCNKTQHVIGPDRELTLLDECVAGRRCFVNP